MNAVVFAVLAGLCWGIGELCTRAVLHTGKIGPMTILMVRAAVMLPCALLAYYLAASVLKSEPAGWMRADGATLAKLLLGSALAAGFGGVLFFYLGLKHGDISVVKPIAFALAPAVAVLLGWMLLGEPMTARKAGAVAMILAGVVVLTSK